MLPSNEEFPTPIRAGSWEDIEQSTHANENRCDGWAFETLLLYLVAHARAQSSFVDVTF